MGYLRAAKFFDRHILVGHRQYFDDRISRYSEELVPRLDCQARDDRQGQRQAQSHLEAKAFIIFKINRTTDGLQIAFDNIHSDATARNGGNRIGGRQAGNEDGVKLGLFRHFLPVCRAYNFRGYGTYAQFFQIYAAAVVDDLDQDLVTRLACNYADIADGVLARRNTFVGMFNPMINRVP